MFLNMTYYHRCILITVYDKRTMQFNSDHHTGVVNTYKALKYNTNLFLVLFHQHQHLNYV